MDNSPLYSGWIGSIFYSFHCLCIKWLRINSYIFCCGSSIFIFDLRWIKKMCLTRLVLNTWRLHNPPSQSHNQPYHLLAAKLPSMAQTTKPIKPSAQPPIDRPLPRSIHSPRQFKTNFLLLLNKSTALSKWALQRRLSKMRWVWKSFQMLPNTNSKVGGAVDNSLSCTNPMKKIQLSAESSDDLPSKFSINFVLRNKK